MDGFVIRIALGECESITNPGVMPLLAETADTNHGARDRGRYARSGFRFEGPSAIPQASSSSVDFYEACVDHLIDR